MIAVRPRKGTLTDLAHVAEARRALADATRCPGSGRQVTDADVVLGGGVLCADCAGAVTVEWVGQTRRVVDHKRPEVRL